MFSCEKQVASNSSQNVELVVQESCTDQSGSLVVYATIDVESIQLAMSGEDPSSIALLPQGFVMVPATNTTSNSTESAAAATAGVGEAPPPPSSSSSLNQGCLLTVGLQVLASTIPSAKLNLSSVTAINNHLCNTLHQIEAALCTDNGTFVVEPTTTSTPKQ